ncbi:MAG: Ig domain-containing protein, partial [Ruminococcaceae bacterium]|nr:Ig domain-containing protein [Oscillospiraceae bacterium]
PKYGEVENWSGRTFFIVGITTATESNADMFAKLKDGRLLMKVVIKDETDNKVYVIDQYAFDNPGSEFYGDASFMRLAVCEYGITPVDGHEYTVKLTMTTPGGQVAYCGVSDVGAFDSFNDPFKADGPIIPAEVPHSYTEGTDADMASDIKATGITIDKESVTLEVGKNAILGAIITPAGVSVNLVWSSDNEAVVTVTKDGVLTAVAAGTATITVKSEDGALSATCAVTVTAAPEGDTTTQPGGDTTTQPGDPDDPTTTPGTTEPGDTTEEEGGFPVWAIILIIVAVLAVAGGAFFFIKKKN